MRLSIHNQFPILEKEIGRYHAFPTLVRQKEMLWMACRSGAVSKDQVHGIGGEVRLYAAHVQTPDRWTPCGSLFRPSVGGTINELDAILSAPAPDLILLATRDYVHQQRNDVYLSAGRTPQFIHRRLLTDISDQYAICFGHVRRAVCGDLLLPGYCELEDEPAGTPILLVSTDRGRTWRLRSKVASSSSVGTRLTEYSLGHLGVRNWTVLIRSETAPFNLYRAASHDDGRSWSLPDKTGLCGHAPMIIEADGLGGHLVLYRDLADSDPGIAVGVSIDHGCHWTRVGRLVSYTGSIYDGGYGDLMQIEDNRYLAVYYLCDGDASPWIDGCVFSIE